MLGFCERRRCLGRHASTHGMHGARSAKGPVGFPARVRGVFWASLGSGGRFHWRAWPALQLPAGGWFCRPAGASEAGGAGTQG